ncbi:MAG: type IV pilin protein [Gallionella sp.]|nr:type IV pilin protein [Gallionella sp.]
MNFRISKGFSLIELLVVIAIVGILAAIAIPSYSQHLIRSARVAAQTELVNLASMQEKIFLNANTYTTSLTTAYDGTSSGGLGIASGQTRDGRYSLNLNATSQTYTLTATPVSTSSQAGDGNISISENGQRLWNGAAW